MNIQLSLESLKDEFKIQSKDSKSVLSLFSGCGGMDLGFEGGFNACAKSVNMNTSSHFIDEKLGNDLVRLVKTGFETVFANDILPDAKKVWDVNFGRDKSVGNRYKVQSIVELVRMHKAGIEVFPEEVDIVTGGFPCQDFSVAGKRKGFNSHKNHLGKVSNSDIPTVETRGMLYTWMREVIGIVKPKMFIAENVKGLTNLSDVLSVIRKDFENANGEEYIVLNPQVLKAFNYGVPQSRERVFFIGFKVSELSPEAINAFSQNELSETFNPYPEITHSKDSENSRLIDLVSLNDVLRHLVEPDQSDDPSHMNYSKAKYMGKHCQGQIEVKMDGIGPTIRAEHHGNIEFRRLSLENGGVQFEELNAGKIQRRLTPRECGLIQSFPEEFEFVIPKGDSKRSYYVSPSKAYKVIGNAVPPYLAFNIAMNIKAKWDLYFKK